MMRWQPFVHSGGVPRAQFAETSSGGLRQYGMGMRHLAHFAPRMVLNSWSRMA
jgi:hypothetical protein